MNARHLMIVFTLTAACSGGSSPGTLDAGDAEPCDCDAAGSIDGPIAPPIDAAPPDDCDPDGPIHPGADEVLDGLDNDCDGLIDEITTCSAGTPFTSLQAAIGAAPAGGVIFVCAGRYAGALTISGKDLTLVGIDGAMATTVDGGDAAPALSVTAGAHVVVQGITFEHGRGATGGAVSCDGSQLQLTSSRLRASHAMRGGGLGAVGCALEVDSVTFESNVADGMGGGALVEGATGAIHDASFAGNSARDGGGLAILEGALELVDSDVRNNQASLQGGGLYHASDAPVRGSQFVTNHAGWTGGGVQVMTHAAHFDGNLIQGNDSVNDGGGFYIHQSSGVLRANHVVGNTGGDDGGGIRVFESMMLIEGNLVEDNTAGDGGGGIRVSHVPSFLRDNMVLHNHAGGTGGGLDLDNDASTVMGGAIVGNSAGGSGGGIFHWLGPWTGAQFIDIRIADNTAWRGGGIFLDDNFMPVTMRGLVVTGNHASRGAGLMVRGTDYTLRNSVFADNDADFGGAIYAGVNSATSAWTQPCPPCPPTAPVGSIAFSVFQGNQADEGAALWIDTDRVTVSNSIFAEQVGPAVSVVAPVAQPGVLTPPVWRYNDTYPAAFTGMADPTGSNGNLGMSPGFVDADGLDFHLGAGSMCVDAGDPAMLDLDGSRADMGRYGGVL